jgi:hypothetical protein
MINYSARLRVVLDATNRSATFHGRVGDVQEAYCSAGVLVMWGAWLDGGRGSPSAQVWRAGTARTVSAPAFPWRLARATAAPFALLVFLVCYMTLAGCAAPCFELGV